MNYFFQILGVSALLITIFVFVSIFSNHQEFIPWIGRTAIFFGLALLVVHIVKAKKKMKEV